MRIPVMCPRERHPVTPLFPLLGRSRPGPKHPFRLWALVLLWLGMTAGLLPLPALGQSSALGTLSGTVRDAAAPIGWANVVLFGREGQVVAATTTQEDGRFTLQAALGPYQLKVSFLGYAAWEQAVELTDSTRVGTITLQAQATELQAVKVTGQKKLVEYQADRVVFNVENSVAATGGDAVQALSAAPGVLVRNNTISLLGREAARVLVNGRLLELSGEELVAYLKAIPASSIKNVEVMTTPPAQYEAAGDGGLLNINLKEAPANSWKSTTTLAYEQNKYGAYALRNNLLYNRNKLRISGNAGVKAGHSGVTQTLATAYPTGPWDLRYTAKQQEDNATGQVAVDYTLTPRTTLGGQYAGSYAAPSTQDYTRIRIASPGKALDSLLINTGRRRVRTTSHGYNAHLVTVLDTLQRTLSVDGDYFSYDSGLDNGFVAQAFEPDLALRSTNLAARNVSRQQVRNVSGKVDLVYPLAWARLSYGAKGSWITSASDLRYFNTLSAEPVLDASRSNTFNYREATQALYVSGARDLGTRLSLQLGLRLENTQTRGYSVTAQQEATNRYLKLFPTAYLSYKPNQDHSGQLAYGRRVNRPGFGLLNPFRSYLNSNSYSEGNPFLQPSFVDNLELTHAYKEVWRTQAFVTRTVDGFGPVFTAEPATNTLVISRQNYFQEYAFGLGENYSGPVTAWWQTQTLLYVLGSKSRFTGGLQATPRNSFQLYASTSNTFTLRPTTKVQVDYSYNSPVSRGLYRLGYLSGLNVAVQQSLYRDRLQVSLLLNDAFNTAYLKDYTSTVNGIRQVYSENNSSRFLRLTLTYNLGNNQLQSAQREVGNDDERRRTQ